MSTQLVATVDANAERYRVAYENAIRAEQLFKRHKQASKEARAQWVDATLELAAVVAETRRDMPDHNTFSVWLTRHGFKYLSPNDRLALIGFGRDLPAARAMLEASKNWAWRGVWERHKSAEKGAIAALIRPDRGRNSSSRTWNDASGSQKRKRRREPVIPTVMRDDYVPGEIAKRAAENPEPKRRRRSSAPAANAAPPYERPFPRLKSLTREQVDPDFKGDAHDFARTYGLVNLQTKQQIEYHKGQEALMAWLGRLSDHERTARVLLAGDAVDPAALHEWMAKPGKAQKLQAWRSSIQLACESLRKIAEHDLPPDTVVGR